MQEKLNITLINKYPSLYKQKCDGELIFSGFDCGNGWFMLIDKLSELMVDRSKDVHSGYVGEKNGYLFTISGGCSEDDCSYIFGLINMAISLSELVCDQCGNRAHLFNCPDIISPRCEAHGGFPLDWSRSKISPDLPFNLSHIGVAWKEMVSTFYLQNEIWSKDNNIPQVIFNRIGKRNGKLYIEFTGGDDTADGMLNLLLAYTAITDENTGDILK